MLERSKVLAIPRTYKGYPITGLGSISSPGFGKCYDLIQITIPSNIVMLNNASGGMFGYCSKLREEGIIFEGEFTTWKDVNTYNTNNNNDTKLYYKILMEHTHLLIILLLNLVKEQNMHYI